MGQAGKERRVGRVRPKFISLISFGGREDRQFFSFVFSFVHSSLSLVWRPMGGKEIGEPY